MTEVSDMVMATGTQANAAVRAWNQLQRTAKKPGRIETLKQKTKSLVYRIEGMGPGGEAIIAKRARVARARLEQEIYKRFLPLVPLPSLRSYGLVEEPSGEFGWLFLEEARGEMCSPELAEHRALAGRWLGTIHSFPVPAELKAALPDRGPEHSRSVLGACRATLLEHLANNASVTGDGAVLLQTVADQCAVLDAHWDELEMICATLPQSLVHGDFAIKNVRIQTRATGPALLVFDWGYAGLGAPARDLAQNTSRTLRPDLDVYRSVVNRSPVHVGSQEIQRIAVCGDLLRLVDEMDWVIPSMRFGPYKLVVKPIMTLKLYEPRLRAALQAMDWSEHD